VADKETIAGLAIKTSKLTEARRIGRSLYDKSEIDRYALETLGDMS